MSNIGPEKYYGPRFLQRFAVFDLIFFIFYLYYWNTYFVTFWHTWDVVSQTFMAHSVYFCMKTSGLWSTLFVDDKFHLLYTKCSLGHEKWLTVGQKQLISTWLLDNKIILSLKEKRFLNFLSIVENLKWHDTINN